MNWLSKISQAKPMPIPFDDTAPIDYLDPGTRPGARAIDNAMSDKTRRQQERQNPDMKYLGHGHQGLTYDLGDKVLKYTIDKYEVERARDLMATPLPCTVKIFNVQQVQGYQPYVWSILMEKVRPLADNEEELVDEFITDFEVIGRLIWKPKYEGFEYLFTACNNVLECLAKDFSTYEARSDNLGWSNGHMVLLDVGPHPDEVRDSLYEYERQRQLSGEE